MLCLNNEEVGWSGSITRLFTPDSRDSITQIKKARSRGPFVFTTCFLLVPVVRVGMGFHLHQFRLGRRFTFDVAA